MASSIPTTHQVDKQSVINEQAQDPEIIQFRKHQSEVVRPSPAEEAKTLISNTSFGVLSTIGAGNEALGYPVGSVAEYALDEQGRPIFVISMLSTHTRDLLKDSRSTLTVQSQSFKGLSDARFSLSGDIVKLEGQDESDAKAIYSKQLPKSFWINFGDFKIFKMNKVVTGRYIGGFGVIKQISVEDYTNAQSDLIFPISNRVSSHMNKDHMEANISIIKHYVGISVEKAEINSIDKLGMNFNCQREGQLFKCRLNYIRMPKNGGDIKDIIVEMTNSSKRKS